MEGTSIVSICSQLHCFLFFPTDDYLLHREASACALLSEARGQCLLKVFSFAVDAMPSGHSVQVTQLLTLIAPLQESSPSSQKQVCRESKWQSEKSSSCQKGKVAFRVSSRSSLAPSQIGISPPILSPFSEDSKEAWVRLSFPPSCGAFQPSVLAGSYSLFQP